MVAGNHQPVPLWKWQLQASARSLYFIATNRARLLLAKSACRPLSSTKPADDDPPGLKPVQVCNGESEALNWAFGRWFDKSFYGRYCPSTGTTLPLPFVLAHLPPCELHAHVPASLRFSVLQLMMTSAPTFLANSSLASTMSVARLWKNALLRW